MGILPLPPLHPPNRSQDGYHYSNILMIMQNEHLDEESKGDFFGEDRDDADVEIIDL